MNYKVRIKRPNKIFNISNIPIRSPFECTLHEKAISAIRARIKFYGLSDNDYEITEVKDYTCIPEGKVANIPIEPITKKEDTKDKSIKIQPVSKNQNKTTTAKPLPKPIDKNFDDSSKRSFKKVESKILGIKKEVVKKEVVPDLNTEQIINNNEVQEVKIEELTLKSKTLLEKFLKSEF